MMHGSANTSRLVVREGFHSTPAASEKPRISLIFAKKKNVSKKGAGGGTRSSHSTRTVFAKRVAPHEGVGRRKGIFFEVANWLPLRASLEGRAGVQTSFVRPD